MDIGLPLMLPFWNILQITTGKDDKGLKIYDPGYLNTAPVRSSICYIDGDDGILRYRGYPIEELAESSSFVEVAYLLSKCYWPCFSVYCRCDPATLHCLVDYCAVFPVYGNLPTQSQLASWEFAISQHSAVPQGLLVWFDTFIAWYDCKFNFWVRSGLKSNKLSHFNVGRISYNQCPTMLTPWVFLPVQWVPFLSSIQMQTLLLE